MTRAVAAASPTLGSTTYRRARPWNGPTISNTASPTKPNTPSVSIFISLLGFLGSRPSKCPRFLNYSKRLQTREPLAHNLRKENIYGNYAPESAGLGNGESLLIEPLSWPFNGLDGGADTAVASFRRSRAAMLNTQIAQVYLWIRRGCKARWPTAENAT